MFYALTGTSAFRVTFPPYEKAGGNQAMNMSRSEGMRIKNIATNKCEVKITGKEKKIGTEAWEGITKQ